MNWSTTYQCEGVGNLADKDADGLDTGRLAKLVAPKLLESLLVLLVTQTVLDVGTELASDIFVAEGVCGR